MIRFVLTLALLLAGLPAASAAKRVALVIGNSAYENVAALKNPANDAADMSAALSRMGFEVVEGRDLDHEGMMSTLRRFDKAVQGADVALLFYAGHALQVGGVNYLAPVDTKLERESDLDFATVRLDFILRQMQREAKTQIVLLDACRDNPLTRSLRPTSRSTGAGAGLARPESSGEGLFIAFATEPDKVALDGDGRNSPFTTALLRHIERPGVEISLLMTDVRREVYDSTGKQQLPFTNSGLLGRFYFLGEEEARKPEEQTQIAMLPRIRPPAKEGFTDWMGIDAYQKHFDANVQKQRYPAEVECTIENGNVLLRGKFLRYPKGRFNFYSYSGMDDSWLETRKKKFASEGYNMVWHSSCTDGTMVRHGATWVRR